MSGNPERSSESAVYGGAGWSPRKGSLRQDLGRIWLSCGIDSEWETLRHVLLHQPGPELDDLSFPDELQLLDLPDPQRARQQHRDLAVAFESAGVDVDYVRPAGPTDPNQMFVADLFVMTPEGAVLGRPASSIRAGEERWAGARLAEMGVPVLHTMHGRATFEGADALWLRPDRVLVAEGFRTNRSGVEQLTAVLRRCGTACVPVELPVGTMHLMGCLRFLDKETAVLWQSRAPGSLGDILRKAGYSVLAIPDEAEARAGFSLNFVTLGPRRVLMPSACPRTADYLTEQGVEVAVCEVDELCKAAGAIGCLTGVVRRDLVRP